MKQNCSVYLKPEGAYVLSLDMTVARYWLSNGMAIFVPNPDGPALTSAVKEVLAHSKEGSPLPTSAPEVPEVVRKNKLKSWRALEKGSQLFGVQRVDDQITVTINKPYNSGGFVADREEIYPYEKIDEIGVGLLKLVHG